MRRFFRYGFPGCGNLPYPGRSPGYGFSWVRQFISVPRCGDFSGTAFLGAAICRTQVGLSWVRLFLGAAIYFRTQVRQFIRYGFPGCGFSPNPGRSSWVRLFLGAAIYFRTQVRLFSWVRQFAVPRSVFSRVRLFLGAAIYFRTQVRLFSWVRRFAAPRSVFSRVRLFLGAAINFRTQVRLFSWVRRLAVPRSVFSRVRLFLGPAFPGYGYSWVYGDLRRRPQVRLFLRYGFSQVRLFFR